MKRLLIVVLFAVSLLGTVRTAKICEGAQHTEESKGALLTTYPSPEGEEPSEDYQVKVNGKSVFVYRARVSAMPFNQVWPGYQRPLDQTEIAAFAYWDMAGPVSVEVSSKRPVATTTIRPTSQGIRPSVDGNRIAFRVLRPQQLVVEVNGRSRALHLFANPPEESAPKPTDRNVRYFGPGVHRAGKIVLKSNETVYIAGGAVVHGTIEATEQSNLRVLGRGILDVSTFERPTKMKFDPALESNARERFKKYLALDGGVYGGAISMAGCQNVHIEGIVIRDSNRWTVVPAGCRHVRVANLKLIGMWRYNTDGINVVNSEDVRIDRCFIRSFDDSICIKGASKQDYWHGYPTDTLPVRNVTVSNCVIWTDWARSLMFGGSARAPEMAHIIFRDCDIIHPCSAVISLGIRRDGEARIHEVCFENIRVELDDEAYTPRIQQSRKAKYAGTKGHCPSLLAISISAKGGPVQNVRLKNITVTGCGKCVPRSSLRGFDADHGIEDVTIENLRLFGKPVRSAEEGRLNIGPHVRNVEFLLHDPSSP